MSRQFATESSYYRLNQKSDRLTQAWELIIFLMTVVVIAAVILLCQ